MRAIRTCCVTLQTSSWGCKTTQDTPNLEENWWSPRQRAFSSGMAIWSACTSLETTSWPTKSSTQSWKLPKIRTRTRTRSRRNMSFVSCICSEHFFMRRKAMWGKLSSTWKRRPRQSWTMSGGHRLSFDFICKTIKRKRRKNLSISRLS